ncbi:hypothetical protein D1007_17410 [Hordeum vulgare]|nr:hypothetical protein D1007_17410 [Hordeum vulgare]
MSSISSKKGQHNGAWLGSDIHAEHVDTLHHRRMLPPTSLVTLRIPGAENAPKPQEGEVVLFEEHFYSGFGLPASAFINKFLSFFGLQPHHLAPNTILQLASFVVLCEVFLGIEPRLDLWQSLFFFKQKSKKMDKDELEKLDDPRPMIPCGAALVHHWTKCGFPQMPLRDSIKQWQSDFFYVKNASPTRDAINMPPLLHRASNGEEELAGQVPHVGSRGGAYRRLPRQLEEQQPLGPRPAHHHDDTLDPASTETASSDMPDERPARSLPALHQKFPPWGGGEEREPDLLANMDEGGDWEWGLVSYDRNHPPPMLFGKLQELTPPAPDMEMSDPSEIEEEGMIETRDAVSEEALESRAEAAKPSEPDTSAPVDLEVNLEAPKMAMDASDAADPPPAAKTTPAGTSMEPDTKQPPEADAHIMTNHGLSSPRAGSNAGSRPMTTWRMANAECLTLTPGVGLSSVPELVAMFASSWDKVKQAARVAHSDLERLEERTRGRLKTAHLEEMKLKDAALNKKEEALIQKHAQLAKVLETAAALQEKISSAAQASQVRELEALEDAHETDTHFDRVFPETREAAETAFEVSRVERRVAG